MLSMEKARAHRSFLGPRAPRASGRRPRLWIGLVAIASLLVFPTRGLGESEPASPTRPDSEWCSGSVEVGQDGSPLLIGGVTIDNRQIFDLEDPRENRLLFRLANRWHRVTRPRVIEEQLLFHEGDPYSPRILDESERVVRAKPYIYDAAICPVDVHDGRVDVDVVTRDVWTLAGGISYGREGGEDHWRFELSDRNLLGLGKTLRLRHLVGVDRSTTSLVYRDPNLVGSHVRLEAELGDSSDGRQRLLDVGRPFYSLESRWAADFHGLSDDRLEHLYERGEIVDELRHEETSFDVSGGLSRGFVDGVSRRFRFGMRYQRDLFSASPGTTGFSPLPEDRLLVYPWIGFESVEDDFAKERDLDKIHRTEDRDLGLGISARLGWSSSAFGGDRDRLVYEAGYHDTPWIGASGFLQTSADLSGRWGRGGVENLLASGDVRFYRRNWGRHLFYASLAADFASHLDGERQLVVGGESGLRGYPLRFQDGDRRVRLTLEERLYTDWHVWQLFHVGAAAFADVGRAWFAGANDDSPVLADVGLGLRLGSSRSARGSLIHVDVAFPLQRDDSISGVQFVVRSHETF